MSRKVLSLAGFAALSLSFILSLTSQPSQAQVNVSTWHNDIGRTEL